MIDIDKAINTLRQEVKGYKVPIVDLIAVQTNDPYKILVCTMLSARTQDETTARAAERLFKKAPDLAHLSKLTEEEIEKLIYPVGFFRVKAAHLKKLPAALEEFQGNVPEDMYSLLRIPGVGRKTANLVITAAFKKPAICVDTHVHRIMNIWGYVKTKTPLETEMALREKLPKEYWPEINSILVAFGQGKCRPVSPHCDECPLSADCPKIGIIPRKKISGAKKFISWNVNGIRAAEKNGFIDFIIQSGAEVFAVQETKAQQDQLSDQLKNINGYQSFWYSAQKKGYSGVGVYTKSTPLNVFLGLGINEFDQEGRVLTLEFPNYYFVNAYFPNAQEGLARIDYKIAFNDALLLYLNKLSQTKSVILCGDLNVAHKAIDLKNPKANEENAGYSIRERKWMDKFIEAAGYVDTFRQFNPDPGNYTWWTYRFNARLKNIGWRIDYFCVDKNSSNRVINAGIMSQITGSDHCPVFLEFR